MAQGRGELEDLAALGLGAGDLGVLGRHVADATAVDDGDLLRAEAHARAGNVHGDVAAADDHDALAREVWHLAVADGAAASSRRTPRPARPRPQGRASCRCGRRWPGRRHRTPRAGARGTSPSTGCAELDVDAAGQDPVDLGLQALARQAVARDAVAEHAAQLAALLEDGDLVAHDGQVVGARKSGGAAADDGDALAGALGRTTGGSHTPCVRWQSA